MKEGLGLSGISDHHLLFFRALLLFHLAEAAGEEALEAAEDEGGVVACANLFVNRLESARHLQLLLRAVCLVVVHEQESLLVGEAGGLHEGAVELDKLVFASWRGRVEDKDDAVGVLLDGTPALLVAPVAGDIPQLDVDLAEDAGGGGRVLLVLNDSVAKLGLELGEWLT